jgi:hypothetical protein
MLISWTLSCWCTTKNGTRQVHASDRGISNATCLGQGSPDARARGLAIRRSIYTRSPYFDTLLLLVHGVHASTGPLMLGHMILLSPPQPVYMYKDDRFGPFVRLSDCTPVKSSRSFLDPTIQSYRICFQHPVHTLKPCALLIYKRI